MERLLNSPAGAYLQSGANFAMFVFRRFFGEKMNNAAASLTYSTLLALVPLLVIAFAILSSFPAFDAVRGRMESLFFDAVVPEAGAAVADYLSRFTENASNLTAVGIFALAVTAVLLLSTIEDTFNRIWHVERPRPVFVRFLIFWAVLTLGPLLIGASFTLTTDAATFLNRYDVMGQLRDGPGLHETWVVKQLIAIGINTVGFAALFALVPARRVRIVHALIGGVFAAVSFELLSWGFNSFLTSGSSYETIYGAVAAVPVFLIWVYTSWMVIILGAVITASIPDWTGSRGTQTVTALAPADKLAIAIAILGRLFENAREGGTIDPQTLAETAPMEARDELLDALFAAGYIVQAEDGRVALARDLHLTSVLDLARDMDLALGKVEGRPEESPEETAFVAACAQSSARPMLEDLAAAERRVLDRPLAHVIATGEGDTPVEGIERIAKGARS